MSQLSKQQIKQILDNAPDWAIEVCQMGVNSDRFRFYDTDGSYEEKRIILVDDNVYPFTMAINCLRTQLALIEENEKLKARALEAENIFYQLVEEQALYCSDFGNLLPVEDQDSEVVRKAIGFMNSHIQKFKELSND